MTENVAMALAAIVGYIVPIASLYFTNKARIKESEHRQTVLEMEVKHLTEKVEHNIVRLDNHDEQSKALFAFQEQVKHLMLVVEEVKNDVKSIMKGE